MCESCGGVVYIEQISVMQVVMLINAKINNVEIYFKTDS